MLLCSLLMIMTHICFKLDITVSQLQSFPSTLVELELFAPPLCVCLLTGVCQSQTTMQDTVRKLYMYFVEIKMKGSEMGHRRMKPDHGSSFECFCPVCDMSVRFCKRKSAATV